MAGHPVFAVEKTLLKKLAFVAGALALLVFAVFAYAVYADQRRLRAATNPCEQACLLDSGGLAGCRELCASHPTTYGPESQPRSH